MLLKEPATKSQTEGVCLEMRMNSTIKKLIKSILLIIGSFSMLLMFLFFIIGILYDNFYDVFYKMFYYFESIGLSFLVLIIGAIVSFAMTILCFILY